MHGLARLALRPEYVGWKMVYPLNQRLHIVLL